MGNAAMQMFKKQREEVQATFNIPGPRKSNNEGSSIENLRDSDPVKVIIKTADNGRRGAAGMVMAMSSDVATEIASTGIISATLTKKKKKKKKKSSGFFPRLKKKKKKKK